MAVIGFIYALDAVSNHSSQISGERLRDSFSNHYTLSISIITPGQAELHLTVLRELLSTSFVHVLHVCFVFIFQRCKEEAIFNRGSVC